MGYAAPDGDPRPRAHRQRAHAGSHRPRRRRRLGHPHPLRRSPDLRPHLDGGRFTLDPDAPSPTATSPTTPAATPPAPSSLPPAASPSTTSPLPGPDPRPEWIPAHPPPRRPPHPPRPLRPRPRRRHPPPHLPRRRRARPLTLRHGPTPGLTPGSPSSAATPSPSPPPSSSSPIWPSRHPHPRRRRSRPRRRPRRRPRPRRPPPSRSPPSPTAPFATLLQHIYAPTGAIIAGVASTDAADRPRRLWLREATDAADTLLSLGLVEPARRLSTWLRTIAHGAPLRADYPIEPHRPSNPDAPAAPPERAGRVLHLAHRIHTVSGARPNRQTYDWLAALVEDAADQRGRPDGGHWDGPAGAWTTSHLWSWAAFDRGARLARLVGEAPRAERWAALADAEATLIRQAIAEKSLIASTLHGRQLDPAVCVARRLGFVTDDTPAWLRTVDALARSATDGLVPTPLGTRPLAATFWTAEALARAGWTDRARALFDAAAAWHNPAGLFPERIDDGHPAGRFPAVAAHTAALRAALALRPG
ncbi:MAG: hypothetical protein R3F65_12415 [bacterium]